eukprot:8676019-Pyramimonas_sp.AAC.1
MPAHANNVACPSVGLKQRASVPNSHAEAIDRGLKLSVDSPLGTRDGPLTGLSLVEHQTNLATM